jgi:hypothetical protein
LRLVRLLEESGLIAAMSCCSTPTSREFRARRSFS